MVEPALMVRGLRKSFGQTVVLDNLDLELPTGVLTVLSGDNGSGKSTLLGCLAGAQPFDSGEVILHGQAISPNSRRYWRAVFGVLDDFAWFPTLTVFDHYRLLAPDLTRADAETALARLGADLLLDRLPMTLSSGQRQRCALTSASFREWSVLLVDEPERHLDREVVPAVAALLADLASRGAVLVATHDETLASLPNTRRHHLARGELTVMS
ncbi:MAG: ABC transporter ATP-binding protein [Nocardioides sp.]